MGVSAWSGVSLRRPVLPPLLRAVVTLPSMRVTSSGLVGLDLTTASPRMPAVYLHTRTGPSAPGEPSPCTSSY